MVHIEYRFDDRQAQTGAGNRPLVGFFNLVIAIPDVGKVLFGNPFTRICHFYLNPVGQIIGRILEEGLGNGNFFILAGLVDGIGQQVVKGLGNPGFIGRQSNILISNKSNLVSIHFHQFIHPVNRVTQAGR